MSGVWGPGRDAGISQVIISQGGVLEKCGSTLGSDRHFGETQDAFLEKGINLMPLRASKRLKGLIVCGPSDQSPVG